MLQKIKNILNSDNGVVLLGNLAASAFGLLTFMLLARVLDKADFGTWALFISAAGLIDLMRTGLVRQGMVRAVATATTDARRNQIIASAGFLALMISVLSALVVWILNFTIDASQWSLDLFFDYYPVLVLVTLPSGFDTWHAHALGQYKRMNVIRLLINIVFVIVVAVGLWSDFDLTMYVWGYLIAQVAVSIYSLINLRKVDWLSATKSQALELLSFGKHSLATLAGSNLLKSADSLIIGAMMGTEAVAIFAIPMKALDLMEIPLRGFVMTAFRKLSVLHSEANVVAYRNVLFSNIKKLTLLCLPIAAVMLVVPGFVIEVLGGGGYEESELILMILVLPMILLPADKFVGASFDSIGRPKTNAMKVWLMVIINIVGDWLVLWAFQSLWMVAVVTIANIIMGITFGVVSHPYVKWNKSQIKM